MFILKPLWNKIASVLAVASVDIGENAVAVNFAVKEAPECFCQAKELDGEAVWQDSCVEVFLRMFDASDCYANFEFNSKGACYAARGKDRQNRTELSKNEYTQITRIASGVSIEDDFCKWTLSVQIPFALLSKPCPSPYISRPEKLEGNLYKCADLALKPHYLSAFPINTPKPDFHRPEFFGSLDLQIRVSNGT